MVIFGRFYTAEILIYSTIVMTNGGNINQNACLSVVNFYSPCCNFLPVEEIYREHGQKQLLGG